MLSQDSLVELRKGGCCFHKLAAGLLVACSSTACLQDAVVDTLGLALTDALRAHMVLQLRAL